jgi:hypothetical protein
MPYFVYKMSPGPTNIIKNLDLMDKFEKYKDAKNYVKEKRVELNITAESDEELKMILAENELEAEEKLLEKREKPILREWEK